MSKNKIFTCQNCGAIFKKWQGKCSECNAWNTIIEELLDTKITKSALTKVRSDTGELGNFSNLNEVEYSLERVDTKIIEINRLLGGGLVRGSAILIA